jgi:hypothetical protein
MEVGKTKFFFSKSQNKGRFQFLEEACGGGVFFLGSAEAQMRQNPKVCWIGNRDVIVPGLLSPLTVHTVTPDDMY